MLTVTRQEVLSFLEEYSLPFVEDSSNDTDAFLRNRLRHRVMPILKEENPLLAENVSAMAMALRRDAEALEFSGELPSVPQLRDMHPALRSRALGAFLKASGVPEPERRHIRLAESLVFSEKPSAWAAFPGGVILGREYDRLVRRAAAEAPEETVLQPGQTVLLPQLSLQVHYGEAEKIINTKEIFTVHTQGAVVLRSRKTGDALRLNVGTQTVKKLFVDRKIPAAMREAIPIFADDAGVLAVGGIGANVERLASRLPAMQIRLETMK
jgi:tRNA(Ile)-lysidine synthase